jgi:hypothetical protein
MRFLQTLLLCLLSLTFGTRLGLAETPPASAIESEESLRKAQTPVATEAVKAEELSVANAKAIAATIPPAKVSAQSQIPKPAKQVLVREGDLYQIYRPLNEAEVKAEAEIEAARQADIDGERFRLVEQLLVEQAKAAKSANSEGTKTAAAQ